MLRVRARDDFPGALACVHANAECFDLTAEHAAATVVNLQGHEPRSELDDVSLQAQIPQRLGCFQSQQAAADDGTGAGTIGTGSDGFEILDRAVHVTARPIAPRNEWHEGIRAGSDDQDVVVESAAACGAHLTSFPVDGHDSLAQM